MVEVGDIVRGEAKRYLERHFATPVQRKAMHDIACCRTAAMGSMPQKCDECEIEYWLYRSCGNRHCPLCGSEARERWLEARRQEILPVEYLQVVFSPPRELNVLALYCPEAFYGALIRATGQAIIDVGWSELHAHLGCQVHLQTWTQTMVLHPHTHCVVPCGGFSEDKSRWVPFRPDDLPAKTLSNRFQSLLCKFIRAAAQQGKLDRLPSTIFIEQLLATVRTRRWHVYAKPPFGGPEKLLEYLSRYTYRVAITNDRIQSYSNDQVTFRWRRGNEQKLFSLEAQKFLRRLLMHVLPKGFVRSRFYGFLGNRDRKENLEEARRLIEQASVEMRRTVPLPEECFQPLRLCPACYDRRPRGPRPHYAPSPQGAFQLVFNPRPPPIYPDSRMSCSILCIARSSAFESFAIRLGLSTSSCLTAATQNDGFHLSLPLAAHRHEEPVLTLRMMRTPSNDPHKLTKAADPLARRRSRLGRLQLHARGTSAAVRSCRYALVAAAAAPLSGAGA